MQGTTVVDTLSRKLCLKVVWSLSKWMPRGQKRHVVARSGANYRFERHVSCLATRETLMSTARQCGNPYARILDCSLVPTAAKENALDRWLWGDPKSFRRWIHRNRLVLLPGAHFGKFSAKMEHVATRALFWPKFCQMCSYRQFFLILKHEVQAVFLCSVRVSPFLLARNALRFVRHCVLCSLLCSR